MRDDDFAALIPQVKEANDIVDVVGAYVALRPAGLTYKGLCPFHDDSRPSFDVDPRRQRYRCWACGKQGDVFSFIQEHEHVVFLEALELLAKRAGIPLKNSARDPHAAARALMLECVRWAADQFHQHLLESDDPGVEPARRYLGERGLTGDSVRRFGLGYAPVHGDWLVKRAVADRQPLEALETVGLIARRQDGSGYYDRFRDRVQFPIRDGRGQPIGFGGRILPTSPLAPRAPKYYNSPETPLFNKSDCLYGLDLARQPAAADGSLVIVEGYTDVVMAHQHGIRNVVAAMSTALTARHLQQIRRFAPRVVLVFDADAGGATGVDRALELFVGQDLGLAVATLPDGLDPCDLLVRDGPEPFARALAAAVDVFEFKLARVWEAEAGRGLEGRQRALDAVLSIIAVAPELPGQAGVIRRQLMVNRLAQRLGLNEEHVWARLDELRTARREKDLKENRPARPAQPAQAAQPAAAEAPEAGTPAVPPVPMSPAPADPGATAPAAPPRTGKPPRAEKELVELVLAYPALLPKAAEVVRPEHLEHPGLRRVLGELYDLYHGDRPWTVDHLRARLSDNPPLADHVLVLHDQGALAADPEKLDRLLHLFRERRRRPARDDLRSKVNAADDQTALNLLRQQPPNALGDR